MELLLTGNEALALGALHAKVRFAAGYPGTPSTEILENFSKYKDKVYCEWAPNEKVALEAAIGGSFAGARSLATMKHVGLNVAADPFFTNAYTGVNAGLVVISADEPGMHSSQNEQDNRNYARHAFVPMFEPSTSQEVYDMIRTAYEVSETFDTPVLFRITTRVCHSKSKVSTKEESNVEIAPVNKNSSKYVTVPANARALKENLFTRTGRLNAYANESIFNFATYFDKKIGIVASGICYEYAREVFGEKASYFKVGFSYPMPMDKIAEFASNVESLYVLEENDPIMEKDLLTIGLEVIGKDLFPSAFELTPDVIREAFYGKAATSVYPDKEATVPRPPSLCAGCPHRGLFYELGKLKDVYLSGDIGCYTLGFAPPYNAIDTVTCMGASISSAHGAQKVFDMDKDNKMRAIAIIGDSTFFHTGINSLIDVSYNKSKAITIILDNRITGMTGHQQNPGSGYTLMGEETKEIDIESLVKVIGIKNVKTINPNKLDEVRKALDWALALDEASVIITRYPCVLKKLTQNDNKEFKDAFKTKCVVSEETCIGCKLCLKSGCPAISMNDNNKATINKLNCVGCEVCSQICPKEAIKKEEK